MGRLHDAILSQGCERGPWLEVAIGNEYLNEVVANTQPEGRQAGDEIKVTPEMIEAGAEMLVGYDLDGDMPSDVIVWIFNAMIEARRESRPPIR